MIRCAAKGEGRRITKRQLQTGAVMKPMRQPISWIGTRARPLTRRHLAAATAGAAASLLLAGCGHRTSPGGTPPGGASGSTPRPGGRVTLGVTSDPVNWDVSYNSTVPGRYGLAVAYESLLGFKRGADVPYGRTILVPELADKWEAPDAQTYTFHLRGGVRFANLAPVNGRRLTSADVAWSYEYWSRSGRFAGENLPKSRYDTFFEGLESIMTPDPATIVVRFKAPFSPFLNYSALDFNHVAPHEIFDEHNSLQDVIVGSGPWQLNPAESQKGTRWVWKRNPIYWRAGRPYIDEIQWLVVKDSVSLLNAFRTKQVDWIGEANAVSHDQVAELKKTDPTIVEYSYMLAPLHLYMNVRVPPLSDLRVRQAISLGIDRDEFIRTLAGGQGSWALAGAFPDTFSQDEIKQILHFDPQRARQLLSDAGHSDGLSLEFIYPGSQYGDLYIAEMQLLQAQLKRAGITLNLKSVDPADFSNRRAKGQFTMAIIDKDLQGDVDSYLYGTFHSGSSTNYGGSNDPKLDAMLEAQRREADPAKRRDIVRQAVRYLNDTAQGLAIYAAAHSEFSQNRLKNYYPQLSEYDVPGTDAWLAG
jgi:ABC-type transport system substrate-binding protein